MRSYKELLRISGVRSALMINLFGRLPNGMAILALTLHFREVGIPFAGIGVLVAVYGAGMAVGGPVLGRVIDHHGQPLVLSVSGIVSGLAFVWIAFMPESGFWLLIFATIVAGALTPPLEAGLRSIWPVLVRDTRTRETALSLDAALQEMVFIGGPALVALASWLYSPMSAVLATALITVVGSVAFALLPAVRRWEPEPRDPRWLGPLVEPELRRLLLTLFFVGGSVGVLTIGAVAYAEESTGRDISGILLSVNAGGALFGGLVYGVLRFSSSPPARFRALMALLALGYVPLLSTPELPLMLVLMVVAGVFLAPGLACSFLLVGRLAPKGTSTEAFAWVVSVFLLGSSVGTTIAGLVADRGGAAHVFAVSCVSAALAASVALTVRKGTRADAPASAP